MSESSDILLLEVTQAVWIGNLVAISNQDGLEARGIKGIITVMKEPLDLCSKGMHLYHLPIDDAKDEDLLSHLDPCLDWIEKEIQTGGKVLVHCQAGYSRSSAVVVAYLMRSGSIGAKEALQMLSVVNPNASPNQGFIEQLGLYEALLRQDEDAYRRVRRWNLQRLKQSSDEQTVINQLTSPLKPLTRPFIRCRKCRRQLADGEFMMHPEYIKEEHLSRQSCSGYFLEPLKWMTPSLQGGALVGKLVCPNEKCDAKVGNFAWSGMHCSCQQWITPAFCIAKSKVDEI